MEIDYKEMWKDLWLWVGVEIGYYVAEESEGRYAWSRCVALWFAWKESARYALRKGCDNVFVSRVVCGHRRCRWSYCRWHGLCADG